MTVSHGTRTGFAPANEDDRSYGPITVSEATDKSVNAVYAQMGIDVGPAKVKATAVDLGIPAGTPSLASSQGAISLGTATPSVLDMTQVYATLAQHGSHRPYSLVDKITKSEQEEIELPEREETTAIPRAAADTTTSILRSVVDGGTGTAAQGAGRPAAGKTGTAEDDKAAWFAGYTPISPPSSRCSARTRRAPPRNPSTAPEGWRGSTAATTPPRSGPTTPRPR